MAKKRKLGIALSGGSARGLAHIGFLEVLEENHIPVDFIVGTSMGALIGGLYSAGKLKEFKKDILKFSKNKILSLLLSNKIKKGNTGSEELEKVLKKYVTGLKIENLGIEFVAIATDLRTGKEVYLDRGNLLKSILASISIPGIFKPVKIRDMVLVDGGVIDPLPQGYANTRAEKVIAVNAMPVKFIYKKDGEVFDVISESVAIITNKLIGYRKNPDHLFIQMKTRGIGSFDIKDAEKIIEIGRRTAKKNLKKIITFTRE